jgi:hypothetical protein
MTISPNVFQYVATFLGIIGIGTLNFFPRYIRYGQVTLIMCSFCWIIYGFHKDEFMVCFSQAVYMCFSGIGIYRWSEVNINAKDH